VRLLLTRPEPDGERTAAALRASGHVVMVAPLLRLEAEADVDFGAGPFAGVVITSANAARVLAAHPRRGELTVLPLYAVGGSSAAAARAAGFANVISAGKDVSALVDLLCAHHGAADAGRHAGAALLYFAAEDRAGDLAGALAQAGIAVHTVTLYRAIKAAALPEAARDALAAGTLDGVLHFSRRSAEAYLECARASAVAREALAVAHYCISAQAAAPLVTDGAARVRIAPHPDEAALLALVAEDARLAAAQNPRA
jgi:uroporphyrinogen-III synthase